MKIRVWSSFFVAKRLRLNCSFLKLPTTFDYSIDVTIGFSARAKPDAELMLLDLIIDADIARMEAFVAAQSVIEAAARRTQHVALSGSDELLAMPPNERVLHELSWQNTRRSSPGMVGIQVGLVASAAAKPRALRPMRRQCLCGVFLLDLD